MNFTLTDEQKQRFFWGPDLEQASSFRRTQANQTNRLITGLMIVAAIGGWASLGCYLWLHFPSWLFLPIWQQQSPWLALFYLSTWADGFLLSQFLHQKGLSSNPVAKLHRQALTNPQKKYDVSPTFSQEILDLIDRSFAQDAQICPLALLQGITKCGCFQELAIRLNLNPIDILPAITGQLQKLTTATTAHAQQALLAAFYYAAEHELPLVTLECLLAGVYQVDPVIQEIFFAHDVDQAEFYGCLNWQQIDRLVQERQTTLSQEGQYKKTGSVNDSYTSVATPLLDQICRDLTAEAKLGRLRLCLGRDPEIQNVLNHFQSGRWGIILTGNAQVGKRTIIEGLAQLMIQEKVPEILYDKRLLSINFSQLIANQGQYTIEQLLTAMLNEAQQAGNIIFSLDNAQELMTHETPTADPSATNLAEVFAQGVEKNQILMLATCETKLYTKFIEPTRFGQVMTKVEVTPPDAGETILMLQTHTQELEAQYRLKFSFDALKAAVDLTTRYQPTHSLPQKAIEVLALTAVKTHGLCEANKTTPCVCGINEVAEVMSEITKIPTQTINVTEKEKLLHLEETLKQEIIGQDEAVNTVAGAMRRARTDLQQNQNQPLASFLFLGPTGVGKTALSLATARAYFGQKQPLIRVDMSEYQQPKDADALIGSPDGTAVGYLTEAVRQQPYSLILFDEIEKAHPNILNLFLQVLDEGRLTNGQGETVSFADTIIVATSNASANYIQESMAAGVSYQEIKQTILDKLLFESFRPEFINRFDAVVVFRPLQSEQIQQIVRLAVAKIQTSLDPKGITITITEGAVQKIAQEEYNQQYGARQIQHFLKDTVENQVATLILEEKLARRDTVVIADDLSLKVDKAPAL